jgi:opacity protein-like surface antigen
MRVRGTITGVALTVAAGLASADTGGWFSGISAGHSEWRTSEGFDETRRGVETALGPVDVDRHDWAWKLFLGYRFNRFLGLELGYANLGEFDVTLAEETESPEVEGFNLSALATLPLGDQFGLFAKGGGYAWRSHLPLPLAERDEGVDFTFGGGLMFRFTPHVALRAEWERFRVDSERLDLISVGLQVQQ